MACIILKRNYWSVCWKRPLPGKLARCQKIEGINFNLKSKSSECLCHQSECSKDKYILAGFFFVSDKAWLFTYFYTRWCDFGQKGPRGPNTAGSIFLKTKLVMLSSWECRLLLLASHDLESLQDKSHAHYLNLSWLVCHTVSSVV